MSHDLDMAIDMLEHAQIPGEIGAAVSLLLAQYATEHADARRERDEARAEIDEARAALAAEQGKSEGAPSDGWRFGPDGWYNGEYVVIVDEVRQQRRAYYWGRCGTHAWKLAPCDHFRAGMLAADMDRSTIANATISGPK